MAILKLAGGTALSDFRLDKLNAALRTMAESCGPRPLIGSSAAMTEVPVRQGLYCAAGTRR